MTDKRQEEQQNDPQADQAAPAQADTSAVEDLDVPEDQRRAVQGGATKMLQDTLN